MEFPVLPFQSNTKLPQTKMCGLVNTFHFYWRSTCELIIIIIIIITVIVVILIIIVCISVLLEMGWL